VAAVLRAVPAGHRDFTDRLIGSGLGHYDSKARLAAVAALRGLAVPGDSATVAALRERLADQHAAVRRAAAEALPAVAAADPAEAAAAAAALAAALGDSDAAARDAAAVALATLAAAGGAGAEAAAADGITAGLRSADRRARDAATAAAAAWVTVGRANGGGGSVAAAAAVEAAVGAAGAASREAAVRALGRVGGRCGCGVGIDLGGAGAGAGDAEGAAGAGGGSACTCRAVQTLLDRCVVFSCCLPLSSFPVVSPRHSRHPPLARSPASVLTQRGLLGFPSLPPAPRFLPGSRLIPSCRARMIPSGHQVHPSPGSWCPVRHESGGGILDTESLPGRLPDPEVSRSPSLSPGPSPRYPLNTGAAASTSPGFSSCASAA
jgi:hypothetical protein